MAGAGILLDPRGHVEQTFAWGLGTRTNNEVEWLALLEDLHLLVTKNLRKVMIFGDSRHVIFKLINGYPSRSINCRRLYDKAKPLMTKSYDTFTSFTTITLQWTLWLTWGPPFHKAITTRTETLLSSNSFHNGSLEAFLSFTS